MGSEVIIIPIIFGVLFGVFYLYFSTRNKERLALIEKGADATIFAGGRKHATPTWKIFIINLALLTIGIGVGLFIASVIEAYTNLNDAALVACVFITAGLGLLAGFFVTKKYVD